MIHSLKSSPKPMKSHDVAQPKLQGGNTAQVKDIAPMPADWLSGFQPGTPGAVDTTKLDGKLAPGAVAHPVGKDLYGTEQPEETRVIFTNTLLKELGRTMDLDGFKVEVGGTTKTLRAAIAEGLPLTRPMLQSAGLDMFAARNIVAAIDSKSLGPLIWE